MSRHVRSLVAGAAALASTACQTYARVAPGDLRPGGEVLVDLTDRGAQQLTYQLGPRVERIEGRVRERSGDTVLVSVVSLTRMGSSEENWPGDTVRLSTDEVSSTRLRRFSTLRSVLFAGALVGGAALAAGMGGDVVSGRGGGGSSSGSR